MVFSLGLGIGANGAVFTLVDAIFLKTLVVRSPDELVTVSFVRRGERRNESSYPVYRDLHELEQVFSGILAAGDQAFVDVTLAGGPLLQASQLRGRRCKTTGGTTIKSSWSQERAVSARSGIGGGVRWSSSWCRVRSCS